MFGGGGHLGVKRLDFLFSLLSLPFFKTSFYAYFRFDVPIARIQLGRCIFPFTLRGGAGSGATDIVIWTEAVYGT